MILETKETIMHRPDGTIMYKETKATIAPMFLPLYPNYRVALDGTFWIRTGENIKYRKDGSIEWQIDYDEFGNGTSIKSTYKSS